MKCDLKSCVNIITQRNMIHRIEALYCISLRCVILSKKKSAYSTLYICIVITDSANVIIIKEFFLSL